MKRKKMNWYKLSKQDVVYDFSHVALNFPEGISQQIIKWGKQNIKDNDLYTKDVTMGRENEIHVTVKYGIHTSDPQEVEKAIANHPSFDIKLGKIDLFDQKDDYDVVVIKIESDSLRDLNKKISSNLECTDSYPIYKPHCTIAYVKKGTANHLKGNDTFDQKKIKFKNVVFNSKNDDKSTELQLN